MAGKKRMIETDARKKNEEVLDEEEKKDEDVKSVRVRKTWMRIRRKKVKEYSTGTHGEAVAIKTGEKDELERVRRDNVGERRKRRDGRR